MILPQIPLYGIALICGLLSFFVTRLTMPRMIRKLEAANIVGKDIHKSWKPIVAEMGGFGILFGFIIGMFSGIYMHDILAFKLVIVLVVILIVGIIGIADDLLALSSKEKFILLFLAGLPLIWAAPPNVGILYLITIPIALSIGSNLTNMLAGLNGIESGLGIISMTSLTIACIILGKYDVTIISMSMLGALIAFLYYNKYPAKIFPGDTGTLIIGAAIVCIAFIGRVKLIAFIVLMPNIIDAALKFYSAGFRKLNEAAGLPVVACAVDGGSKIRDLDHIMRSLKNGCYRVKVLKVFDAPKTKEDESFVLEESRRLIQNQLDDWRKLGSSCR